MNPWIILKRNAAIWFSVGCGILGSFLDSGVPLNDLFESPWFQRQERAGDIMALACIKALGLEGGEK